MRGEGVDGRGKLQRDARADDHHRRAGQHRAVERGQVRHLDLLEEIDAHRAGMAFAGQEDLHEVRRDAQLLRRDVARRGVHAVGPIGRGGGAAAGDEMRVEDLPGDLREGEVAQGAPHVALPVAVLQAARQDHVQAGSRNDPQLAQPRHRLGQAPVGNPGPHASLNDLRQLQTHRSNIGPFREIARSVPEYFREPPGRIAPRPGSTRWRGLPCRAGESRGRRTARHRTSAARRGR